MKKNIKRIFAVFLCAIILTSTFLTPASAANTPGPNASSIVEIDPNILEDAGISTYSLTAAATTVLAANGVKIVVATALVPVFSYLIGKGIDVENTGLPLLEKLALSFFLALDGEWQSVLELWAENGGGNIEMTDEMSAAFEEAFQTVFYEDDGTFVALTGLAFDPSMLLAFNSEYHVNGSTYPADVYAYELSFDAPSALGSTGLTAQLVTNPIDGANYGVRIINTTTGVVATYAISSLCEDMVADAQSFKISVPAIEERTTTAGDVLYEICWFVLGEFDSSVSDYRYRSFTFGDADNVILDNLVNFAYNGSIISVALNSGATVWQVLDKVWEDICTPGMYVTGTARPVEQDEEYSGAYAGGATLYVPLEEQYASLDTFTAEQAREGVKSDEAVDAETKEEMNNKKKDATVLLHHFFDLFGDRNIGDMFGDFIKTITDAIDDFKNSDTWQGVLQFFNFMRSLWLCLPDPVTSFMTMSVCLFGLIAVLKIFIH